MAWFLAYLWKRPSDTHWQPADATTVDEHPVAFINRARQIYASEHVEYRLTFFAEISDELISTSEPPAPRTTVGAIPRQPLNVK